MVTVIGGHPSETGISEGAVDILLWRNNVEGPHEGKIIEGIVRGKREMFYEDENKSQFGDAKNETRPGRVGPDDAAVEIPCGSRRA